MAVERFGAKPAVDTPHYFLPTPSHSNCTSLPDSRAAHSYVHSQAAAADYPALCNCSVDMPKLALAALVEVEHTSAELEGVIVIAEGAEHRSAELVGVIGIAEVVEHKFVELVWAIVIGAEHTSEEAIVVSEKGTH